MWRYSLIIIFLIGCKESEINPSGLGLEYYPLEVGLFRVYQVQNIQYSFSAEPDTSTFQLMERYSESFEDLEGGISFKLERLKRNNENDNWKIDSVWVARKNNYTVTQVENNVPLIKLSFPLEENRTWDANSLNDKSKDNYTMVNVRKSFELGDSVFSGNTTTVIQEETTDNILFRNIRKEIFSEDIGLIYKEVTLIEFCADVECVGQDIIESGIDYKQWMIDYGQE